MLLPFSIGLACCTYAWFARSRPKDLEILQPPWQPLRTHLAESDYELMMSDPKKYCAYEEVLPCPFVFAPVQSVILKCADRPSLKLRWSLVSTLLTRKYVLLLLVLALGAWCML